MDTLWLRILLTALLAMFVSKRLPLLGGVRVLYLSAYLYTLSFTVMVIAAFEVIWRLI